LACVACEPVPQSRATSGQAPAEQPDPPVNPATAFASKVSGETFKHPYSITLKYDKVDDYTLLDLAAIPLGNKLKLNVYAVSPGTGWRTPTEVVLFFSSTSESWKYLTYNSLRFLVDDSVRIDLGDQDHRGTVGSGYVLEQFFATMSVEQFLELAGARTVAGKLGSTDFALSTSQVMALRDFGSRLAQPKQ
jgi:hypothetical protein